MGLRGNNISRNTTFKGIQEGGKKSRWEQITESNASRKKVL